MSESWNQTVLTALMGTERQKLPPFKEGGVLATGLVRICRNSAETALLDSAALIRQHAHGGKFPLPSLSAPRVCPDESLPTCGHELAQSIRSLFIKDSNPPTKLLLEVLERMARARHRVPHDLIPDLLNAAAHDGALRVALMPVLGERGNWLARQVGRWKFAVGSSLDTRDWETETLANRLLMLKRLRVHQPEKSREWIESTWREDPADARAEFIRAMALNLSLEDEQLLETALDDRSQKVRESAAELLGRLADSKFAARMGEWASRFLRIERKDSKVDLSVELPHEFAPEWKREGVPEKTGNAYAKAYWLTILLTRTPPRFWSNKFSITPEEIIQAVRGTEFEKSLREGFIAATLNYRDADWAKVILDSAERRKWEAIDYKLLAILPVGEREKRILARIKSYPEPFKSSNEITEIMWKMPGPPSKHLSRAIFDYFLPKSITIPPERTFTVVRFLSFAAQHGDPCVYEDALNVSTKLDFNHVDAESLPAILNHMRIRALIHKEYPL